MFSKLISIFKRKSPEEVKAIDLHYKHKMQQFLPDTSSTNPSPVLDCDNWQAFKFFWRFVRKYQLFLVLAIGLISAGSSIDGYLIYNIKFIVNQGGGVLERDSLIRFAYILVFLMSLRALFQFASQYLFTYSQNKLVVSLGEKVFGQIASMPQAFFDIHGHGKIISKIQYEVGAMSGATGGVLLSLTRDGSTTIAFLVVMFKTNWALSSVIFILLPVIYITIKLVTTSIKAVTQGQMSSSEVQIRLLNEMVKGHQVVNLYNAQEFEHQRYFNSIDTIRRNSEKGVIVSNLGHSFIQFIASLLLAAIIFLAAYSADLHIPNVTPGGFIVIFTSMFALLKPVRNLTNVYTQFISSLTAAKSILGILAIEAEEDNGTLTAQDVDFTKDIEFRNVVFTYPTRLEEKVLNNFNLTVEAGKTYALVGKSGGGKSTIVSLLPRIYNTDLKYFYQGESLDKHQIDALNAVHLKEKGITGNYEILPSQQKIAEVKKEVALQQKIKAKNLAKHLARDPNYVDPFPTDDTPVTYITEDDLLINLKNLPVDKNSGIFIDGHNIRDIKLSVLRDNISVVSQNVHLFDDTIYNNIIYCDQNEYTREEVIAAAKLAHVTDFTDELPDGIDTVIGSDGTRLSGGQRQRVSIARALLRKKPILILDEATSALDNESEFFIQNSLHELQKDRTVLVIAHRLSTIEKADQILVIKAGQIIEHGTHEQLIENTHGEYFKLYTRDFEE